MGWRKRVGDAATYAAVAVMLVIALFPVYWMAITSLKGPMEIFSPVPGLVTERPTLRNYSTLFGQHHFLTALANSLTVSLSVSVISIILSALAAYALARIRFRGNSLIGQGVLISYLMPRTLLFIPLYLIVSLIGLANNLWALIFVYPTITIPYATWVLITYFQGIPIDIEEAALVDGCSRLQALRKIVIPVSAPGIVATFIFSFTLCWSEYIYALVMISDQASSTVTLALSNMIVADVLPWGPLMAGAVIASIPVVVLYSLASRFLVSGLTLGAVKG